MIIPVKGKITTDFYEPRPLSNPGEHVHGAVDIAAPVGFSDNCTGTRTGILLFSLQKRVRKWKAPKLGYPQGFSLVELFL